MLQFSRPHRKFDYDLNARRYIAEILKEMHAKIYLFKGTRNTRLRDQFYNVVKNTSTNYKIVLHLLKSFVVRRGPFSF